MTASMYRVAVENGVRCAVEDLNPRGRRAVLFVHGWPMNRNIFENQMEILPRYGIRCIGVDLRGYGQSDRPYSGYGYNRLADDLSRIIAGIDCKCLTLCGFGMGAAVCIRYLARHGSGRVGKLVLCSAAAPSFVQRPGYGYGMSTQQIDSFIGEAYANRPKMVYEFCRSCFAQSPGEQYLDWFSDNCLEAAGWSTIQAAESMRDEDLRGDLEKVCVPCAIFHGIQDRICPYAFASELQRGIAGSVLVPFDYSGHMLVYEERDKCNASLVDFITG